MEIGTSSFMAQVQGKLSEIGSAPALTGNEQDIVAQFQEQEFSAERCAERIVEHRGVA